MQRINNIQVRQEIEKNRLTYIDVAHELGIHRCTLSIWLHDELSDEKKQMILDAIERIK